MPDQKISQMDPAAALTGAELVPAVQSGGNVRTTTQDIANLVSLSSLGASANGITLIGHTFAQMRADLDLEAGTDFVAYSAYSANALTLIGHTFSQMRTDLGLVIGTDVQAYDANTAKLNVAQTWTTDQTFTGLLYNRAAFAAIGVLSSTGASGYGIRFSNTGASSDSVLLQGTTNSFTGAVSIANIIPSTGAITWSGVQTFNSNLTINKNDPVLYLIDSSVGGSGLFYTNESDAHRWGRTGVAYDMTLTNDTLAVGALNVSGNVKWGNTSQGTLTYAGSDAYIDSSGAIYLRPTSGNLLVVTEAALVDRGSAGASLLYVGGANNQGANIVVRANAGYSRGIVFDTGVSSARWYMEATSTAESGGNAGSNFAISAWTDAGAFSSTPFYIARSHGTVSLLAAAMGGPINMKSYTVAGLPAGSAGDVVYASDGRKNGEGAGLGTGVLVFKDGTAWRACDTGATVAA